MNIFDSAHNFLDGLERKQIYQMSLGVVGGIIIIFVLIWFWNNGVINSLKKEVSSLNKKRAEAQELINKYTGVQEQRKYVADLIAKNPTFKIKEVFLEILSTLHLEARKSKEPEISPEPLEISNNEYNEVELSASFTGLNMRNVVDLLEAIEKNKRLYTKEVTFTKAPSSKTLDFSLIIATLQPKVSQT